MVEIFRRGCLILLLFVSCLLSSVPEGRTESFDRIYSRVDAVLLHLRVSADQELLRLVPGDKLLFWAKTYISDGIEKRTLSGGVLVKPYKSTSWPNAAFDDRTLTVLIQVSLRDIYIESSSTTQCIGVAAIRLRRETKRRGVDLKGVGSFSPEPFICKKEPDELLNELMDTVGPLLDRAVIEPFNTVPENF